MNHKKELLRGLWVQQPFYYQAARRRRIPGLLQAFSLAHSFDPIFCKRVPISRMSLTTQPHIQNSACVNLLLIV